MILNVSMLCSYLFIGEKTFNNANPTSTLMNQKKKKQYHHIDVHNLLKLFFIKYSTIFIINFFNQNLATIY